MSETCPLCDSADVEVFLERVGVPVLQNFPLATPEAARSIPRGDLRLACCPCCGFITNLAFSDQLLQYGAGYENDQTFSPLFEEHVAGLSTRVVQQHGVTGKQVVEVGCGQGRFLRAVCASGDNRGTGFDPAYTGPSSVDDGRVQFVREYYGPRFADRPADAVLCRHVIEHVPSPLELLGAVRGALANASAAAIFFETPDVAWILDGTVIQDFFYEHCSYFTAPSLTFAFERAGFSQLSVEHIFGDQYLWLSGRSTRGAGSSTLPTAAARTLERARGFAQRANQRAARLRAYLEALRARGPVAVWGAGAKGVTFMNELDPDGALVDCVIDINPRKQSRFLPGTAHPIVAPAEVTRRGIVNIVAMNPNYVNEIRADIVAFGGAAEVVAESAL